MSEPTGATGQSGAKTKVCIVIDQEENPHPEDMGKVHPNQQVPFHSGCIGVTLVFTPPVFGAGPHIITAGGSTTLTVERNAKRGAFTYKITATRGDTTGGGEGGGEVG